jgi:hypothetical protein
MGERSRAPETEEDAAKLSLRELNARISRAEFRALHLKFSASLVSYGSKPSASGFTVYPLRIGAASDRYHCRVWRS